jgi:hypothetical protein
MMMMMFTIELLHEWFEFLCSLLMTYWLNLCVLSRTCRQNRLYETLFHTVIILNEHYHHHHHRDDYDDVYLDRITQQKPKNILPYVKYRRIHISEFIMCILMYWAADMNIFKISMCIYVRIVIMYQYFFIFFIDINFVIFVIHKNFIWCYTYMYMYICIYIYIYINICMYIYIHIHMYSYIYIYTYTWIYTVYTYILIVYLSLIYRIWRIRSIPVLTTQGFYRIPCVCIYVYINKCILKKYI